MQIMENTSMLMRKTFEVNLFLRKSYYYIDKCKIYTFQSFQTT